MSFRKFIIIPIFIAFQAFLMMLVFPKIPLTPEGVGGLGGKGLLAWAAFQAWAMYFLAGCNPKMGAKTFVAYLGGIIASIAIFELGDLFAGWGGGTSNAFYWGYAFAVLIVVVPVISAQKVPGIDFVPGYFIGAGAFFGIMMMGKGPAPDGQGTTMVLHQFFGQAGARLSQGYMAALLPVMTACLLGLVWGWGTVTFQTWYTEKVTGGDGAGADAEKKPEEATA
ncbi:MAG: DUF1097 domain-containing protein [Planctomycetota bacterium]|jgi:hypothetical protein